MTGGAKVPVLVPLKPSRVSVALLPPLRGRREFPAGTRRSEEAFLPARLVSAAALPHTGRNRQEDDGSVGGGEGQPVVVKVAVVAAIFVADERFLWRMPLPPLPFRRYSAPRISSSFVMRGFGVTEAPRGVAATPLACGGSCRAFDFFDGIWRLVLLHIPVRPLPPIGRSVQQTVFTPRMSKETGGE